jgi:hypothetical protein
MNMSNSFFIWTYIFYLLKIIKQFLKAFFPIDQDIELVVDKSPIELYYENNLKRFLSSFEVDKKWNFNIEEVFYKKENYLELLKDVDNVLEKKWKMRILIEHTPRGNVFMYYDPYKLGFSYYCDQYVPYNILNVVAMKYVLKFHCRDFFMDEHIVPDISPSPLLALLVEEKKAKEIKEEMDSNIKNRLRNAPFAKFKNYNRASLGTIEEVKKEPSQNVLVVEKQKERNRFINLGKTCNFSILQPVVKKKRYSNMFKSKLASSLNDNSSVQNEVFSYRDFLRETKCRETKVSPDTPSFI